MTLQAEVLDKMSSLLTASFGVVAALSWNEAISSLFKEEGLLYFLATYGVWVYAILVTLLAVVMTVWIGRVTNRIKEKI